MKRIFAAALAALLSFSAFAATLVPVPLLSPAGSTSGQAILSTGPSGVVHWASMTPAAIGGLTAANNLSDVASTSTALANLGGLSAPTAASTYLTQTSAASTYLTQANATSTYATKAGTLAQFAATTSAQLAGVLSDETGTGVAVFNISPAITTPVITGVTSGAATATGKVGEHLTASAATVSITSGSTINVVTLPLTAGVYEINAVVLFTPAGTTVMQGEYGGVSTTSATLAAFQYFQYTNNNQAAGQGIQLPTPMVYVNQASSFTAYCVASAAFTVSTATVSCKIDALRVQ